MYSQYSHERGNISNLLDIFQLWFLGFAPTALLTMFCRINIFSLWDELLPTLLKISIQIKTGKINYSESVRVANVKYQPTCITCST